VNLLGVVDHDVVAADALRVLNGLLDRVEQLGADAKDTLVDQKAGIVLRLGLLARDRRNGLANQQHLARAFLFLLLGLGVVLLLLVLLGLLGSGAEGDTH